MAIYQPNKQRLPIFLEPDLLLEPEVRAKSPVCYPQNECEPKQLAAQDVLQSAPDELVV